MKLKDEYKNYVDEAYEIVKHASEKIGPRLPGSENEKRFADYMGGKLESIGIKSKREPFLVAPRASIGGLSNAGWVGIVLSALVYVALAVHQIWFAMAAIAIGLWVWLVSSVFLYHTWFDRFFKCRVSQNTYGELLPPDGKYDYTIILSAHTDTSWNWKHSEKLFYRRKEKPAFGLMLIYLRLASGAVSVGLLSVLSVFMALTYSGFFSWCEPVLNSKFMEVLQTILLYAPVLTAFFSLFLTMWADPDEKNASPGAMDNATGCALSYEVTRYFRDHPEKMPKNCRIIDLNCGSEEAGLRGSIAFTREHKGEEILDNVWNINIDSVADDDYFEVVIKDDWQFTRFDRDMEQMFKDTFRELGIESKTGGCIHNPVGGCDSTPFTKAGARSVTLVAQDPRFSYYYHTFRDTADRFSKQTVGKGFEVVLGVIDKIDKFQSAQ